MTDNSMKSEMIADALAEEIIRGEHPEGARLAQDHIAARFACSHVPVREALQKLVQMELAVSLPRRGVRVVTLSRADHQEILDMRLALEPLALRQAVALVSGPELSEIEALRRTCDAAHDPINWEKANREFHLAILAPCARPRLLRRIGELQRLSAHRFHTRWQDSWHRVADRDHAAIVDAMRNSDAERACTVLLRHLTRR
ncbi:MAG: GntR family transcriptional regulator [Pelagimonas sp.]|jgi:DNA-binding GntR family transcriptional regulator|nr:GntR family transcriptional regulator [Pelagimonas sp.]